MTTIKGNECESLRAAAEAALRKGWYIFGSPYKTKATFAGSHGSKDALNDDRALLRWEQGTPANPCIRLDKSGLTVLDADHGLTSIEHAEAWSEANGIPATYIVSSGRQPFGCHFYFKGTRTLPDVTRHLPRVGFELNGVSGDIKCHGHVVAEGGLHKSGLVYRGNGRPVALLPQWLRDYEDPLVKAKRTQREAQTKVSQTSQSNPTDIKIASGRRHNFLLHEAGRLRWQGLETEAIYLALKDICRRFCDDGENYADSQLRQLAQFTGAKPCDRRIRKTGLKVPVAPPTPQQIVAGLLRQEFKEGCLVPIHAIMERVGMEHSYVSEGTLRRAMKTVGFMKAGKDPADRRKQLWTRGAEVRDFTPPCPLITIDNSNTAYR
jgi:hypothetical protein